MILEQIPIRLQLNTFSSPPVAPVDANTGMQPQFWRAQDISIQVGIFDQYGVGVDLSNLSYLQVGLFNSPTDVVPLVVKTVSGGSIIPYISKADWDAGTAQNAAAVFSALDTDRPLGGSSTPFWLVVTGATLSGNTLVYGAGYVTIFNPGGVPANTPNYVTENSQANASGNTLISPQSQLHLEILTVSGSASLRLITLSTVGLIAGARPIVFLDLPATPSIALEFHSGTVSGPTILTYTTDGTTRTAAFEFWFNGSVLQTLRKNVPAI